ncbi:MAG: iron-containing alcohol dehydrogenase [Desulfarculaceae bacterium]
MYQSVSWRTPEWMHFGFGTALQVGPEAKRLGAGKVMVLSGPNVAKSGIMEPVFDSLKAAGLDYDHFDQVEEEPTISNFYEALTAAKAGNFDVFVGVGGGSALDITKMVAAMIGNDMKLEDTFGVDLIPKRGRPSIMVVTTSGTGSEATRISVFTDVEAQTKRVVSAWNILADVAIVDPNLTVTMPSKVTADTGIDAFIHALESYIAVKASPLSEIYSLKAIELCAQNLGPAFANGKNLDARYNMSLAALLAGITLNNAGVGVLHAFSFPIGREYKLTHGPALTAVLPATMLSVSLACPEKFRKVAEAFGIDTELMDPFEACEAAVDAMANLIDLLGLPSNLSQVGADRSRIGDWAKASHANRRLLDNTPRDLSEEDLHQILEDSF